MRSNTSQGEPRLRGLWRSRWAAIGAAVAVTLGGGGMVAVNAASSPTSSVVTIDPVRILDTRDPVNIGLPGPFVSAVSQKLQVAGAAGVPAGATGVLLNVTVVSPSAAGFLSVRPGDATGAPSTSSLNFGAGDLIPNAVQVGLPTAGPNAGRIDITYDAYGVAGPTTEVLIDVVGYMVAGAGGTPGPQGPAGPSGVAPQDVIWVAKSGGQFTTLSAAMNSITGGGPHLINVGPGTYVETAPINLKNNVDIAGSGQDRTTITCACAIGLNNGLHSTLYAGGTISAEIRDITITNSGGAANVSVALQLDGVNSEFSVVDTTLTATNAVLPSFSAAALWIDSSSNRPHIDNINTYTAGAPMNFGVYTRGTSVTIRNSWIYISGPGNSVYNTSSGIRLIDSVVNGATYALVGRCVNVFDINNDVYPCA